MDNLTNDAKYLLSAMYKNYLLARKNGTSKQKAVYFGSVADIHKDLMSEWSLEDVQFTCFELRKHELISGQPADNTLFMIRISTEAIALLEKNFSDQVDNVLAFMKKIKDAIPFF